MAANANLVKRNAMTTLWQKARVRAAILGRYVWRNPAAGIELAVWSAAIVPGVMLHFSYTNNALRPGLAMLGMSLAILFGGRALQKVWILAVKDELNALDQALNNGRQASRQPAGH